MVKPGTFGPKKESPITTQPRGLLLNASALGLLNPSTNADFDGGAATTFSILPGPGNAAGGAGLSSSGQPVFQQWSNPAYMRMVKALVDLQGDVLRYRAIQILLMVSYVGRACRSGSLSVSFAHLLSSMYATHRSLSHTHKFEYID